MPQDVHHQFLAIVIGGSRRQYGMPGFGDEHLNWPMVDQMTPDEAQALHAYIIDLQWAAYDKEHRAQSTSQ